MARIGGKSSNETVNRCLTALEYLQECDAVEDQHTADAIERIVDPPTR